MIADQLKRAVLQAAIQGRLTEQLPEDGDTRELLEEIKAEKEWLIKEGKTKKGKSLPEITEDEIPFDIPDNWCWARLGSITSLLGDGIHGTPIYKMSGQYKFINGNNLVDGKIEIKNNTKNVDEMEYKKYKKPLNENSVLVSINGTLGNVAFYNNEKVILGKSACFFNLLGGIYKEFISYLISSDYFVQYANEKATGTTIKNVSLKAMRNFPVPIPPLSTQSKIVEKINYIIPYISKLKSDEKELDSIQDIFPQKIKSSIIQAGIQGKLTMQLTEDGDARELLEEIKAEKDRLIKEGKIKKEKPLPEITEDEIPFEIPDNWCWCRLLDCCDIYTGNSIPKDVKAKKYSTIGNGLPYIGTKDVSFENIINYENGIYIPFDEEGFRIAHKNSILLCLEGGSAGRKIGITNRNVFFGNKLCKFEAIAILPEFVFCYLQSSEFQKLFISQMTGIIGGVGVNRIKSLPIPLPPLPEQQRIVQRIEELLPLCDSLE